MHDIQRKPEEDDENREATAKPEMSVENGEAMAEQKRHQEAHLLATEIQSHGGEATATLRKADQWHGSLVPPPEKADSRHHEATETQWRSSRNSYWNSWWQGDGWGDNGKAKLMNRHPGGDWSGGSWKAGESSWKGSWEDKDEYGGGVTTSRWDGESDKPWKQPSEESYDPRVYEIVLTPHGISGRLKTPARASTEGVATAGQGEETSMSQPSHPEVRSSSQSEPNCKLLPQQFMAQGNETLTSPVADANFDVDQLVSISEHQGGGRGAQAEQQTSQRSDRGRSERVAAVAWRGAQGEMDECGDQEPHQGDLGPSVVEGRGQLK